MILDNYFTYFIWKISVYSFYLLILIAGFAQFDYDDY